MTALRHPLLHRLLAIALGAVFVYASFEKIAQPRDFARIVYHYQVIGPSARLGYVPANLLAVALPWTEAVAGALLIAGIWRREAALAVAAMLLVFIGAVGFAMHQGIDVENCGCFTVEGGGRGAGLKLILQDLGLLAVAFVLAFLPPAAVAARAREPQRSLTLPVADE